MTKQLARDGYGAPMRGEAEVVEGLMTPDLTWGAAARIGAGFVEGAGL
jgi:hypothetical protein